MAGPFWYCRRSYCKNTFILNLCLRLYELHITRTRKHTEWTGLQDVATPDEWQLIARIHSYRGSSSVLTWRRIWCTIAIIFILGIFWLRRIVRLHRITSWFPSFFIEDFQRFLQKLHKLLATHLSLVSWGRLLILFSVIIGWPGCFFFIHAPSSSSRKTLSEGLNLLRMRWIVFHCWVRKARSIQRILWKLQRDVLDHTRL